MKYTLFSMLLIVGYITCWSNVNSNITKKSPSKVTNHATINFGKYYPIENFNIDAPFSEQPIQSSITESNPTLKSSTTYRSGFLYNKDYFVLGVTDYVLSKTHQPEDSLRSLSLISSITDKALGKLTDSKLVSSRYEKFKGRDCIISEYDLNISFQGVNHPQKYYTTVFNYRGAIISLFAIAPIDKRRAYISNEFFNSVRLK